MTSSSNSHPHGTKEFLSSSLSRLTVSEASSSTAHRPGKEVAETRNWVEDLPHDVVVAILQKIGTIDLLKNVQNVCVSWRNICKDPALWRSIDIGCIKNFLNTPYDIDSVIKHAIDRSCGQLIDINLEYFWDDDILKYITDRKNQLRRLRLGMCLDITNEGLIEAAKKMPFMEELHIHDGTITYAGLENVGRSCPGLKSLTFSHQGGSTQFKSDCDALAISISMPDLLHLSLAGNLMTNTGLKAILDGCPHLESLDLRRCYNVNLTSDPELGKRCSSAIKTLRLPSDPYIDDNDFNPRSHELAYTYFPDKYLRFIMGGDDDDDDDDDEEEVYDLLKNLA